MSKSVSLVEAVCVPMVLQTGESNGRCINRPSEEGPSLLIPSFPHSLLPF
jgi:hypothetical protein